MEQWHDKIHEILTYNPNSRDPMDYYDNNRLSNQLSPCTNFFLNTFINIINKKNLIVFASDSILRPVPLLSYFYSFLSGKSTLVFTQKGQRIDVSPIDLHLRNYYMLNWEGEYLFYDIPIGIMNNNEIKAGIYLPRVENRERKKSLVLRQEKNFLESEKPKILLYHDKKGSRILSNIQNLIIDKRKFNEKIRLDFGCIIFENLDRFVYSDYTAKVFLKWLKNILPTNINLIFHFSNPQNLEFINKFQIDTNSFVLPFTPNLLKNNEAIKQQSIDYFNAEEQKPIIDILNRFNLDTLSFYDDNRVLSIIKPILEEGNIDYHYEKAQNTIKNINNNTIKNKGSYYAAQKILNKMPDLVINPSKYKLKIKDDGEWKHQSISEILNGFENSLQEEENENQFLLARFLSDVNSTYSELSQCKRFFEEETYNRIGKDYRVLELANNIEIDDNTIFVTYSPTEKRILEEEFIKLGLNSFNVEDIKWISYRYLDRSNTKLILPGPLITKNLTELFLPYKEIHFLAYGGLNSQRANDQIDLILEYSFEEEKFAMRYISQVFDYFDVDKNNLLFNDFEKREREFSDDTTYEPDSEYINPFDKFRDIIIKKARTSKYQDQIDLVEEKLKELEKIDIEIDIESEEYVEVYLRDLTNNNKYLKKLPRYKTYFYLKTLGGNVEEGVPSILRPGNYIVILDNDERKSLLQLIIDMFGLEENIEKSLIEYWKKALIKHINKNKLSINEFYNEYSKNGGQNEFEAVSNWAKGGVLGPRNPVDLLIIGKVIDNEIIQNHYMIMDAEIDKVRIIHRMTGRRLRKIIKTIIFENEELKPEKLDYEEFMFYEKVKNGIYEVVDIKEN